MGRAINGKMGLAAFVLSLALTAAPVSALKGLDFQISPASDDLTEIVRQVSLLAQVADGASTDEIVAAAQSDYARILSALYAKARYAGTIRILIDGREAAEIAPLDAPATIRSVQVVIETGPVFRFSRAEIAPLAPGTDLPEGYAPSSVAVSGIIAEAAQAGTDGWRAAGHAKAAVAAQRITADHPARTLASDIALDPGPRLRFGPLKVEGADRMEVRRILKIAGLPTGTTFDPRALQRSADRLRRSGVFSSVTLVEDETVTRPDLLGVTVVVVEERPRRYRFGAEIATVDGLSLSGGWLHRNLLGGGERFSVDAEINQIGAPDSGIDYRLGVAIERPATPTPDTTARLALDLAHVDDRDYTADSFDFGLSFRHVLSEQLTARAGLTYSFIDGRDLSGSFSYRNLSLPLGATWDRRDDSKDAKRGFYLDAEVKPFLGFGTTGSGVRLKVDGRGYRRLGGDDSPTVLAARVQAGAVLGTGILTVPRDELFYSGGGGTVRGQPYQSLGIAVQRGFGPEFQVGGTHFLGASVELRSKVGKRLGLVGFADIGQVTADGFFGDLGDWHAGAGFGLRYETGLGPIRLDIAAPVGGNTGDGAQIYVGLGQSF